MAIGDPSNLRILGTKAVDDSGNNPPINGFMVAVRFEGMGRRHPITDPVANPASLTIIVDRPGFDSTGSPIFVRETVRGTLPLINSYPRTWTALGSGGTVPPRSWCCNGTQNSNIYYTESGGTRGANPPVHVTNTTVSDGGVSWTFYASGTIAGYQEEIVGANADVFFALDFPIYAADTIVSASIGAGAYTVGGTASNANAALSVTNNSTLQYEIPQVHVLTPPHRRSSGSYAMEIVASHVWPRNSRMVAAVKMQAWNAARSTSSAQVTLADPVISADVPATSPGGRSVECYRGVLDTSGISAGDGFVEYQIYPHIGNRIYDSRYDGEGADWQASKAYGVLKTVIRNGSNFYHLTTAGNSAASGGPTGTGTGITDGTCVWSYFGNSATATNSANPQARHHFYNDPSNLLKRGFACVNATGANIGSPVVHATEADALAAKSTASYGTMQLAGAALQTYHNTAGGGLTTHNDPGGGTIICLAGTHPGFGASMQALNVPSVWLYVKPDPEAAPGAVVFGYNATAVARACSKRMWLEGFTATATTGALIDASSDGLLVLGQPITELWVAGWTRTGNGAASNMDSRCGLTWYRNSTFTGGLLINNGNSRAHPVDVCGCSISGASVIRARAWVGSRFTGDVTIRDPGTQYMPAPMFLLLADNFVTGGPTRNGISIVELLVGVAANPNPVLGGMFTGNLVETYSTNAEPCVRIGADGSIGDMVNVGIFNNTAAGERFNFGYNDQAANPLRSQWFIQGNVWETRNTVSGYFAHAGSTKLGTRSSNFWCVYNVAAADEVSFEGSGSGAGGFSQDTSSQLRIGLNSSNAIITTNAAQVLQFVGDRSKNQTGTGLNVSNGDYRPASGAEAIGRASVQRRKYDQLGNMRLAATIGAVGAFEAASTGITGSSAVAVTLGMTVTLAATGAQSLGDVSGIGGITSSLTLGLAVAATGAQSLGGVSGIGGAATNLVLGFTTSAAGQQTVGGITGSASVTAPALALSTALAGEGSQVAGGITGSGETAAPNLTLGLAVQATGFTAQPIGGTGAVEVSGLTLTSISVAGQGITFTQEGFNAKRILTLPRESRSTRLDS